MSGSFSNHNRNLKSYLRTISKPNKAPVIAPPQGLHVNGHAPPAHFKTYPMPEPAMDPIRTAIIIFNVIYITSIYMCSDTVVHLFDAATVYLNSKIM